ncbi:MAG: hypothetical protein JWO15_3591 [Sphingomonadales bacterium]|nr:hypothetical protein [Sphingomonadales bacterium]
MAINWLELIKIDENEWISIGDKLEICELAHRAWFKLASVEFHYNKFIINAEDQGGWPFVGFIYEVGELHAPMFLKGLKGALREMSTHNNSKESPKGGNISAYVTDEEFHSLHKALIDNLVLTGRAYNPVMVYAIAKRPMMYGDTMEAYIKVCTE